MNESITSAWTVEDTLTNCPGVISVFIRLRTNCVGCWLARFCTLEEVGQHYGLDLKALLDELRAASLISSLKE